MDLVGLLSIVIGGLSLLGGVAAFLVRMGVQKRTIQGNTERLDKIEDRIDRLDERIAGAEDKASEVGELAVAVEHMGREMTQAIAHMGDRINQAVEGMSAANRALCETIRANNDHFNARLDDLKDYVRK